MGFDGMGADAVTFLAKRILDALMDVPFALPTAVAGISLTALYSANGWFGGPLQAAGIEVVYTLGGVTLYMAFTSTPFVVHCHPAGAWIWTRRWNRQWRWSAGPWRSFAASCSRSCQRGWQTRPVTFALSLGEFSAVVFRRQPALQDRVRGLGCYPAGKIRLSGRHGRAVVLLVSRCCCRSYRTCCNSAPPPSTRA